MKLILSVIVLWTVFSTAEGIDCEHCVSEDDLLCMHASVRTCPNEDMCLTAYIIDDRGNQRIYRDCTPDSLCPGFSADSISVNLGPKYTYANVSCCSTDRCNSDVLDFPDLPAKNTLSCAGCDPPTADCSSPVECRGEEDTCIDASVVKVGEVTEFNGCGTANVCNATDYMNNLPFMEDLGTVFVDANCIYATPTTTTAGPTTTTTPMPTTTTTPMPTTTTTPMPTTTTTPMPTTTTTPMPTATTEDTTIEPTTPPCPSNLTLWEYLENSTALLRKLHRLSSQIKPKIKNPYALSLLKLHQHMILFQIKLMEKQKTLEYDHDDNMPMICQHNMALTHQQLLLHQIHQHLPPQLYIPQLFNQQLLVSQLQQQVQMYQQGLMLHYYTYPLNSYFDHSSAP